MLSIGALRTSPWQTVTEPDGTILGRTPAPAAAVDGLQHEALAAPRIVAGERAADHHVAEMARRDPIRESPAPAP